MSVDITAWLFMSMHMYESACAYCSCHVSYFCYIQYAWQNRL